MHILAGILLGFWAVDRSKAIGACSCRTKFEVPLQAVWPTCCKRAVTRRV
jgi:hypothetical protein